jgi:hypothetical protein
MGSNFVTITSNILVHCCVAAGGERTVHRENAASSSRTGEEGTETCNGEGGEKGRRKEAIATSTLNHNSRMHDSIYTVTTASPVFDLTPPTGSTHYPLFFSVCHA